GYVGTVRENLFRDLSDRAHAAFEKGSGGEMHDTTGRPAKMRSLHSSSALVVNVFDHWTRMDPSPLARALGLLGVQEIAFEAQFPTGLEGNPPNLDLAISVRDGSTTAIESKFTEWMIPKTPKRPPLKSKYFPKGSTLWATQGLPRCQGLARAIQDGVTSFTHLDVAQLLKHALGLATQRKGGFSLWYVYMDAAGPEGTTHRAEVD